MAQLSDYLSHQTVVHAWSCTNLTVCCDAAVCLHFPRADATLYSCHNVLRVVSGSRPAVLNSANSTFIIQSKGLLLLWHYWRWWHNCECWMKVLAASQSNVRRRKLKKRRKRWNGPQQRFAPFWVVDPGFTTISPELFPTGTGGHTCTQWWAYALWYINPSGSAEGLST